MRRWAIFGLIGPFVGFLVFVGLGGGFKSNAVQSFLIVLPFAMVDNDWHRPGSWQVIELSLFTPGVEIVPAVAECLSRLSRCLTGFICVEYIRRALVER